MPQERDEYPFPPSVKLLVIVEILCWLAVLAATALFTLFVVVNPTPDRGLLAIVLVAADGACLANLILFTRSLFKTSQQAVAARFGALHNTVAIIAAVPPLLLGAVAPFAQDSSTGWGGVLEIVALVAGLIAAAVVGLVLSRRQGALAPKIGAGLGALCCFVATLVLLAVAASAAVAGGMTH